jgi:hypothetical protein
MVSSGAIWDDDEIAECIVRGNKYGVWYGEVVKGSRWEKKVLYTGPNRNTDMEAKADCIDWCNENGCHYCAPIMSGHMG